MTSSSRFRSAAGSRRQAELVALGWQRKPLIVHPVIPGGLRSSGPLSPQVDQVDILDTERRVLLWQRAQDQRLQLMP
jgi:hypothetical protein